MSSHIPVPETEQALADAYNTLANSKQAPGKRERLVDELGMFFIYTVMLSASLLLNALYIRISIM